MRWVEPLVVTVNVTVEPSVKLSVGDALKLTRFDVAGTGPIDGFDAPALNCGTTAMMAAATPTAAKSLALRLPLTFSLLRHEPNVNDNPVAVPPSALGPSPKSNVSTVPLPAMHAACFAMSMW